MIWSLRLFCCTLSVIACLWASCHLLRKSGRVREQVFWAQLVALVIADLLLSVEILLLSVEPTLPLGVVISSTLFWSFFLEVQIALGVTGACSQWTGCSRALRFTILGSLPVAIGLACLDSWVVDKDPRGRALLWSFVIVFCLLTNIGAYVSANKYASASPFVVRRRIMMRGSSYAFTFAIAVLPNLILDVLIAANLVRVDSTVVPNEDATRGTDTLIKICGLLYCLNGFCNVGTYVLWILWDEYVEARVVIGGTIADIEQTLQLNGYFNLEETATLHIEARHMTDPISQPPRGGMSSAAPNPMRRSDIEVSIAT